MSQQDFDYYENRIAFVEALVNSYDVNVNESHPEHLETTADLDALLRRWGLLAQGEAAKEDDLTAIRRLRGELRAVFEASDESIAAKRLNRLLEGAPIVSALRSHAAADWYLDLRADPTLPLARRIAVEAALGLADAVEAHGFARLSVCEADPCRDVFLDISRNRSRRYCGSKCANRANVAAFRQRHRG